MTVYGQDPPDRFFFAILSGLAFAQKNKKETTKVVNIHGLVSDDCGGSVQDGVVRLTVTGLDETLAVARTDAEGGFLFIKQDSRSYDLHFEAPDLIPMIKTVGISSTKNVEIAFQVKESGFPVRCWADSAAVVPYYIAPIPTSLQVKRAVQKH